MLGPLFTVCGLLTVGAQTTIFNVPTAETQPRGSWGIEADLITKPVPYRKGGFQSYGYRVVYGLGNRTEAGSNFYLTNDGVKSTAQAEFSLKQKFYQSEKRGIAAAGGTVIFVPLRARNGDRAAGLVYANASKSIKPMKGLTVTGGVYHVFRGNRNYGTKTGAIVGVVQPITRKFSFVADWYSGRNRLGYASAALNFAITKRQYLMAGYSFGNSGRGNNAFAAYYGFMF